jgi:hypothetical protein
MRWIVLLLFWCSSAQTLTQTFVDRCTGEVKIVQVSIQGSTAVAFYNKTAVFTAQDYYNGNLRDWMEEVYAWWAALSPCSTGQAVQNTTQNVVNNVAANIPVAPPAPPDVTPPPLQSSPPAATSSDPPAASAQAPPAEDNSGAESGAPAEQSQQESEPEQTETESTESESTEETEATEESSEESSEEKKQEKKKVKVNPIMVASNLAAQAGLDGSIRTYFNASVSQSSLTGTDSYSLSSIIGSTLKEFTLNGSKSHIFFNYDRQVPIVIQGLEWGHYYDRGSIMMVQSISTGISYNFGVKTLTFGISNVYLGQKDNKLKGFAGGYAITLIQVFSKDIFMTMPSLVAFGTKPFSFDRITVSPMLAFASVPVMIGRTVEFSPDVIYVVGSNFDFNLTKMFYANIGGNVSGSTAMTPLTYSVTIGSKFKF